MRNCFRTLHKFFRDRKKYLDELQKLAKSKQDDIRERNKEIEEGVFAATADPKEKSVPPSTEELPPT